MSIVTLEQAKAQGRITWTSEDDLLQAYVDAAELHACRFLNRNVYADDAGLAAAVALVPETLAAASEARDAAYSAWQAMPHGDLADIFKEKLDQDWARATEAARMTYFGMAANAAFVQAVVLLVAGWAVNREFVITELSHAIELPMGVTALLFPYRVRQGV